MINEKLIYLALFLGGGLLALGYLLTLWASVTHFVKAQSVGLTLAGFFLRLGAVAGCGVLVAKTFQLPGVGALFLGFFIFKTFLRRKLKRA